MFLPWYGKSVTETVKNSLQAAGYDLSAFGAFSFVEAAVLLVASAVLALVFARAERRAFHLPGGDGLVILAAGVWVSVLIFYRMLDKPGTTGNDRLTTTVGLQWGIFFALAASISLAYAGARVRAAHRPEPALRDDPTVARRVVPAASRPTTPAASRPTTPAASRPTTPAASRPTTPAASRPTSPASRPASRRSRGPAAARPPTPLFDADAAETAFDSGAPPPRSRFPPPPPAGRPDADPGDGPSVDRRPAALPPADEPPTRVNRRVPRFDDLDAEWTSTEKLPRESDRQTRSNGER